MGALVSLFTMIGILFIVFIGVSGMGWYSVFGVIIPYGAMTLFILGFLYRVLRWASSPVPFHIPTVCGQQRSLHWIKSNPIDSPYTNKGVVTRLALEILFFRSLLKNEKVELREAYKLLYKPSTYLWLGAMAFHWSFIIILIRHLRLFLEPVPAVMISIQWLDSVFQGLIPVLYTTDILILISLGFLFFRRLISPQIRYISLPSDYFVILLIAGIAISGVLMRLFFRADLVQVKTWVMGMIRFHPTLPQGVGLVFYIHLFFVSLLIAYFPVSKLMHMPGIFLSPTRNLTNTSRNHRHINPWDAPAKVHTYEEWEEEFREAIKEVGLPLEKE
ncbi:MAG: sulfate reduction electron transfer complex DsrMKJOP subunit DsrM [Thermodesulfobacteriota bacterium]